MIRFCAEAVAAGAFEDVNTFLVTFADTPDGSAVVLTAQIALDGQFSDQDRELGQDTYCIVFGEGACAYGCVESWRVIDDRVQIILNAHGQEVFETDGFDVRIDPSTASTVRTGLERVFDP